MSRVQAGEVQLGWREWGKGDVTVVFIHGNLASKDWIELAAPMFPSGLRVVAIDWRGCGDSDRPQPVADYSNYSMQQHAQDMLAALDALGIRFCHLATHSTGGIIAARMLLMQPERFGRVFALDPVTPLGMSFNADQIGLFRAMMGSKELTRTVMATAASLFVPESMTPNAVPRFRDGLGDIQALFDRIIEQTFGVSEGIWIGTPVNLTREKESRELERRMPEIRHPHLVLWGERDGWIPPADLRTMAAAMPDCRLVVVPNIGHSMNLELPALYAGYFGAWFGGFRNSKIARFQEEQGPMADLNPSAENMRAMMTEALGRLRKASTEYFDLLEKGLSSSPLPVAGQAKQFCEYMQRNVTATFDLGDKLIQAKDIQDALRLQSDFFQQQMQALTSQAKNMGESAMKAATGAFIPKI